MANTQGDSSHSYWSPESGGSLKSVKVLSEAVCSPDEDSSQEEKDAFKKILDNYIDEEELPTKKDSVKG